jgi:D-3-phosphoglycerate dehydrogenase
MKVLIADKTDPICARTLQSYEGIEVVEKTGLEPQELSRELQQYEAMVVRSATKVTREIIGSAKRLKVIGRAGAGVDNIDVQAASERGILVMNTPGGNANAVAELAVGLMFALARRLAPTIAAMKEQRWEKKAYRGSELAGKTLGLLGIGQVGARVARKAAALDMKVLACDPFVPAGRAGELGVRLCTPEELFRESDFLSLHLPKNEQTAGTIDRQAFAQMKPGVFLVNCARGGIVVEQDLLQALEEERVAGAAIDVYQSEPPADWSLVRHPRVIATPHIGATTAEAQIVVAEMIARQIGQFLFDGTITNAVNAESI